MSKNNFMHNDSGQEQSNLGVMMLDNIEAEERRELVDSEKLICFLLTVERSDYNNFSKVFNPAGTFIVL